MCIKICTRTQCGGWRPNRSAYKGGSGLQTRKVLVLQPQAEPCQTVCSEEGPEELATEGRTCEHRHAGGLA